MSAIASELIASPVSEPPLRELYLTSDGEELRSDSPRTIDSFLDAGNFLIDCAHRRTKQSRYGWVGRGELAYVYEMPDDEDVVVKIGSKDTIHRNAYGASHSAPSLKTEARFMHALGAVLEQASDGEVMVPRQYAVARFPRGMASLQHKVPEGFATLSQLCQERGVQPGRNDDELLGHHARVVEGKVRKALGKSVLRHGVSDLIGSKNLLNLGNFFIERDRDVQDSRIYVIDLVHYTRRKQALALAATAIARI